MPNSASFGRITAALGWSGGPGFSLLKTIPLIRTRNFSFGPVPGVVKSGTPHGYLSAAR